MNRIFVIVTVVVLSLFVPVASAQAQENTTETTPHLEQIDDRTQLLEWDYSSGTFTLRFNATVATTLTITESVQFTEGVGQISIHQQTIPAGESTVSVPIERHNGEAGVTIVTARSLDQSSGVYVSTGQSSSNPFASTSSTAGWLGGAATVGLMFITVAWRELRKEPSAPEVVE